MKSKLIILIGIFVMLMAFAIDSFNKQENIQIQQVDQVSNEYCFKDSANLYGEMIRIAIPCLEYRPHLLILESTHGISTTKLQNLEECTAVKGAWLSEKNESSISRQAEAYCILIK